METLELVVARYREDVRWVRKAPRWFRVTVYNKGETPPALPYRRRDLKVCDLPNTGREDQAYLQHIVSRYDTLSDVTVFAQGHPFDHEPAFHRVLRDIAMNRLRVDQFKWLGFIIDEDDKEGGVLFQSWAKNESSDPLPLDRFWHLLWGSAAPDRVQFFPSAHFVVTAEQIRQQPRVFYEKALGITAELPHAAHCFERVWDRVFGVCGIPPAYRAASKPVYLRKIRRMHDPDFSARAWAT